jgi:alpha-mannosidase
LPEIEVLINDQDNAEIALTLLRCIGWLSRDDITTRNGHAGPMGVETPGAQMIGRFSFDYSVIPDDNEWRNSITQAYAFNAPLHAVTSPIHPGTLPFTASLVENTAEDFIITAVKYSEDGSGLITRGFNRTSIPIDVTLKTWKAFKRAQLVNLAEKFIENLDIQKECQVSFHVDGHKIVTVKFTD